MYKYPLAVHGRGYGQLHAQNHRGHVRGGLAVAEADGAAAALREGVETDDSGSDVPREERGHGAIRH